MPSGRCPRLWGLYSYFPPKIDERFEGVFATDDTAAASGGCDAFVKVALRQLL